MTNEMNARIQAEGMTREQMIIERDYLEANWTEDLRPLMLILSKACIKKFKTTLVRL